MEFRKASILGVIYGSGYTEVEVALAKLDGRELPTITVPPKVFDGLPEAFSFYDPRISLGAWQNAERDHRDSIVEFFKALALTHTVMIEVDAKTGKKSYRAASPDEGAFVLATKCLGWEFSERTLTTVTLAHQGRNIVYDLLHTLEFCNDRKCQSVVVREHNGGQRVLYTKGADKAMYANMLTNTPFRNETDAHLTEFAEVRRARPAMQCAPAAVCLYRVGRRRVFVFVFLVRSGIERWSSPSVCWTTSCMPNGPRCTAMHKLRWALGARRKSLKPRAGSSATWNWWEPQRSRTSSRRACPTASRS